MKQRSGEIIYTFLKGIILRFTPNKFIHFLKKYHYSRVLKNLKIEEFGDLIVSKYLIKYDDYVIDIGANVGAYTKFFANFVGTKGRVYSLEPISETFDLLCYNIKKLKLKNVVPLNYAVSNTNSVMRMRVPEYPSGGKNYYEAHIYNIDSLSNRINTIKVKSLTMDDKFASIAEMISFVKVDVEGHENACLNGAKKFLKSTNSVWFIEISEDPDIENSKGNIVFKLLSDNSYSAWWFDGGSLKKRTHGDKSTNYYFLKSHHIDMLKRCPIKLKYDE